MRSALLQYEQSADIEQGLPALSIYGGNAKVVDSLRLMESRRSKRACTITYATTTTSALSSDCKGSARWNTG